MPHRNIKTLYTTPCSTIGLGLRLKLRLILSMSMAVVLVSCATPQYEADAGTDQLVEVMQDLPEVKPYLANVTFYPELQNKSGKAEADNVDERNLNKIIFPEDEMLNLAGHASIFRWFKDDGNHPDLPLLNVHARIYKLDHSIRVVKGRMQPIAKTKIEVFLTDSQKNRIYESVFTAIGEGQEGKLLRNKRETQDIYGQAIYKAMLLAFESAFADISNDLELRPIDFDIDNIEVAEEEVKNEAEVVVEADVAENITEEKYTVSKQLSTEQKTEEYPDYPDAEILDEGES